VILIDDSNRSFISFLMMTLGGLEGLCVDIPLNSLAELVVIQSECEHEVETD